VQNVSISQPAELRITGEIKDDSQNLCFGDANGSITITAIGGTAPLQYSIDNGAHFQASNVFTNLPGGSYITVVKDANGCQKTGNTNVIDQPSEIIVTITTGDVTQCYGDKTGFILAEATGGTGALRYSIDGGITFQGSGLFSNLGGGSYTVITIDDNGCTKNNNAVINQPPAIVITSLGLVSPTCHDVPNGSINASASGGTGSLSYSLDGGPSQPTGNYPAVGVGPHTLRVTDNNSCKKDTSFVMTAPPAIAITNVSVTHILCNGQTNGSITVTATGGTSPLSYTLNPGSITNGTGIFTNLGPNTYSVSVTDANLCPPATQNNIDVIEPPALVIDSVKYTDSICSGSTTGSITIYASGGTLPYEYTIDNGSTWSASQNFSSLGASTYQVQVRDKNLCQKNYGNVTIASLNPITITTSITHVTTCYGDPSGSITVTASGGRPPYQYSKDGGTSFQPSNVFSSLPAGSYIIAVRDAAGCTQLHYDTIRQPSQITMVITPTHVVMGNDGKIDVVASGGTGTINITIDNWLTSQPNPASFTNLNTGKYYVKARDANGCEVMDSVVLTSTVFNVIVSTQNIRCFGANDGEITLTVIGGTTPYSYSVVHETFGDQTPASEGHYTNLRPGIYYITVSDAASNVFRDTVTLTQPPMIALSVTTSPVVLGNPGSITIIASGGTGSLQYSIDSGATYVPSSVFSVNDSGWYNIAVRDSLGCIARTTAYVDLIAGWLTVVVDSGAVSCPGGNDGHLYFLVLDGTDPIVYSIDSGQTFLTGANYDNLRGGKYYVIIKDVMNKQFRRYVTVPEPDSIKLLSAVFDSATCNFSTRDGKITQVTLSGGTPGYTYEWKNQWNEVVSVADSLVNARSGYYSLKVKDSHNCQVIFDSLYVPHRIKVNTNIALDTLKTCLNAMNVKVSATGADSYLWTPASALLSDDTLQEVTVYNLPSATETLRLTVKGTKGICYDFDSILIVPYPSYPLTIVTPDTIIAAGATAQLTIAQEQQGYFASYRWSPCPDSVTSPCNNVIYNARPASTTIYFVTAVTLPEAGQCEFSDNITITVVSGIYAFSAFTPNGDGINDYWVIKNAAPGTYPNMKTTVFNRWGEIIMTATGCKESYEISEEQGGGTGCKMWDGKNKKGVDVPVGVYYYIIDPGNGSEKINGTVTISR